MAQRKPVPGRFKRQLQTRITWILLSMLIMYCLLFLPKSIFSLLSELLGQWADYSARLGVAVVGSFAARWVIFTQDSLANGSSRYSEFFRSQFPDKVIMGKYHCTKAEATTLWFQWFNKWEEGPDHYALYHRLTFSRSYGCRLIYYLRNWLFFFFCLGFVTLGCLWLFKISFSQWSLCLCFLVAVLLVYVYLSCTNRIPKKDGSGPTSGCWRKFQEISEMQVVLLERAILRAAPTYDDAWSRVSTWPCEDGEA